MRVFYVLIAITIWFVTFTTLKQYNTDRESSKYYCRINVGKLKMFELKIVELFFYQNIFTHLRCASLILI